MFQSYSLFIKQWRQVGFEGRQTIEWQATKRLGAKVFDRTKVRGTQGQRVDHWQAGQEVTILGKK
jgi:hypothetical protein